MERNNLTDANVHLRISFPDCADIVHQFRIRLGPDERTGSIAELIQCGIAEPSLLDRTYLKASLSTEQPAARGVTYLRRGDSQLATTQW